MYIDREKVKKLLTEYMNKNLLISLQEISSYLLKLNSQLDTCSNDYSYWGLISERETYNAVKIELEKQLIQELIELDCSEIKKLKQQEEVLNKTKMNYERVLKDLEYYKPSQYKEKINLITEVYKHVLNK